MPTLGAPWTEFAMSVEAITQLLQQSSISHEDMAKRMFVSLDELESILSGQKRVRRLHIAGLERASLSLALEKRDPNFVSPSFSWQMLRYAMLVLQEHRPTDGDAPMKDASKT